MDWLFLIPLAIGFALVGASAFTAAYSKRWSERSGQLATFILRNVLGIPLLMLAFFLAWRVPTPLLFPSSKVIQGLGWFLIAIGLVPIISGHLTLRWRTHMPSVRDFLVRRELYSYVRHPIYGGMMLGFIGLALLRPTSAVVVACTLGLGMFFVQSRLEELDLLQRLPAYREYMTEVPAFLPRLSKKQK